MSYKWGTLNHILFQTGWDKYSGTEDYCNDPPYISEELANFLVSRKIKAVGVDMPSIDSFNGKELVA